MMKALRQLEWGQPLELCEVPIPEAGPGAAVVRVLSANLISYTKQVYDGTRKYPYPTPLTVGSSAIGRVHAVGPDNTGLKEGQLVCIDIMFRSRNDPTQAFLSALHEGYTAASKTLMSYWRDGSFAEYMACPLENLFPISPAILRPIDQGGLGYTLPDLGYIAKGMIPYGGLADINLRPGETIIVAPATGGFGGAAVHVALSMGARVIAVGRNTKALDNLRENLSPHFRPGRLLTVPATDSVEELVTAFTKAAGGIPIDCFFDISPPVAANAAYFKAAILALRHSGRISLMGGQQGDVSIPHSKVMHFNLQLRGKWMYEPSDVRRFISMIETGTLVLGERGGIPVENAKTFKLEEWKEAFDYAEEHNGGLGMGGLFEIGADDAA